MAPPVNGHGAANGVSPKIIHIRGKQLDISLEDEILEGLVDKKEGEKSLPTMLLYSAEGLKLFEEITYLQEYYLTNKEIGILEEHAEQMAKRIEDGSVVVELGSGNLRKVNILLNALGRQGKHIDYYALDLDLSELKRTLAMVPTDSFENIRYHGLHGTYDDGREWLKTAPEVKDRPRCILWIGSSIGNFEPFAASQFLKLFAREALRAGRSDYMLVGLDGCKDSNKVYPAYNDSQGVTAQFAMSGLPHANKVLDGPYFNIDDWGYHGEWNADAGRHQAFYVSKKDIRFTGKLDGVTIKQGERVHIEYSHKFDDKDSQLLWEEAGLSEGAQWANEEGDYYLRMLQKPNYTFPSLPAEYASEPTPTLAEWKEIWAAWDMVTLGMVSKEQLLSKPINLRNPCIFYIGHIPTFLDSLITRATSEAATGPELYLDIFQRGIDPDVDNPGECHPHSEIPDTWPELDEILVYTKKVRRRVLAFYKNGSASHQPPHVQRAIWLGFEHEAMHLETLLYMLLQTDSTRPPPGVIRPDFAASGNGERKKGDGKGDCWVQVPEMTIDVGMNDPEDPEDATPHHWGWDNEKPVRRDVKVSTFYARTYPITNEEYARYLHTSSSDKIPASWGVHDSQTNGYHGNGDANGEAAFERFVGKYTVKTVFGPVSLKLAFDWPAMASYDELSACAVWMNSRVPTAEEVWAIYQHAEGKGDAIEKKLSRKIDAVNGHLIHNGVYETPPEQARQQQGDGLFSNMMHKNVGFKNWHPVSVRGDNAKLLGRGETGGAWEWTSTVLELHEGFKPTKFYPEYTVDFADGKHNIVLGGSWATHPRLAGRKSFVNWYQRNYRYTWATARPVKDKLD